MRLSLFLLATLVVAAGCLPTGPATRTVNSSPHIIISQTGAGEGLRRSDKFLPIENQPGELIWLTGARLTTSAPEQATGPLLSRATVMMMNPLRHVQLHRLEQNPQGVLFSLSPGVTEVEFPEGFGIPVNSNEPVLLATESQCPNELKAPLEVSFGLALDFVRQRGLQGQFEPLYGLQLTSLVSIDGEPGYFGVSEPEPTSMGPGTPTFTATSGDRIKDHLGREFGTVWLQGLEAQTNRTLVTSTLRLQRPTKLHHATGQMSARGESLELYDLTESRTVLRLERLASGVGFEQFSNGQGIDLFPDHEYELVTEFKASESRREKSWSSMMVYVAASRPEDQGS